MLKYIFLFWFLFNFVVYSQNFQTHYDFGKDRNYVTTTFQIFKPDDFGSTFMFIDFDFNNKSDKSISLAYIELARYFKISGFDYFEPTIQYNDGVATFGKLNTVWLFGVKRRINNPILNFNFELLFRNDSKSDKKDIQLSFNWIETYYKDFTFTGFIDIWSKDSPSKKIVLLAEPQIWYNIWNKLHIGSELEVSNNFIPNHDEIVLNPTIAIKWSFD